MSFIQKLKVAGAALGCLLQVVLWGGGLLIHFIASLLIFQKYGFIFAFVSFGLPVISTVWALWITISAGIWWYTGLVVTYVVFFIISIVLIAQADF